MPIAPKPFILECQSCGWKQMYRPASDVLNIPSLCPHCSQPHLKICRPTRLEKLIGLFTYDNFYRRLP